LLILKYALNLPRFVILGKNMTEQGLSRLFLMLALVFYTTLDLHAQLWSTDFEGTNTNVTLNTGDLGGTSMGQNEWIINAAYAGGDIGTGTIVPGTPAQPGAIVPINQNYLHIVSTIGQTVNVENSHIDTSASAGEIYFAIVETGLNTVGLTDVELNFWFLNGSPGGQASVHVKDGITGAWTQLADADFSIPLGNVTDWTNTTYTGTALNGLTNVILGFRFNHASSTTSGQPSFSLDNLQLTSPDDVTAAVASPNPLPTAVCIGDVINFSAATSSAITSYQWNFNGANNGAQIVNGVNVNFQAINPGTPTTYTFELTVSDGINTDVFSFNVLVSPCTPPDFDLVGDPRTICEGTSVSYMNLSTPGDAPIDSIRWTFPGGTPATSNLNNPVITYNTAGVYNVSATLYDANDSYDTIMNAYINVIACPVPTADFVATATELCPGDCIGFIDNTTNMNGAGSTWLWEFEGSDSATSQLQNPQNICYQTAGLYTVKLTATNVNGTDIEEKIEYIQVDSCLPPIARFEVERDSLCRNMCVQFFNRSLRSDSIQWIFYGADQGYDTSYVQNPTVCYSDTGQFAVQLSDSNIYGADILLINGYISIADYPQVIAGADQTIIRGIPVQLEVFGTGTSYLWTPDVAINNPTSRFPTVNPTENTRYYVTTTNAHGCSATDSLRVLVRQEYYAGIPDIFSPNNDGENDELKIRGNGIQDIEFYVYNRYGEKVFESENINIGWNGTYSGEDMNPGVFVYFAKITYENGFEEILKGDVTLVR